MSSTGSCAFAHTGGTHFGSAGNVRDGDQFEKLDGQGMALGSILSRPHPSPSTGVKKRQSHSGVLPKFVD